MTNTSLPVMFNVEDLQTIYFKGNCTLMNMWKQARMNCNTKYANLKGVGSLERTLKTIL